MTLLDVVIGLKGPNSGKAITLEDFDLTCRNILNSVAPIVGVDVTEQDVNDFKQLQFEKGKFKIEKM